MKESGLVIILFILSYRTASSQTDTLSFRTYKLSCIQRTFVFSLPKPFEQEIFRYTDGVFYRFKSSDNSRFVFHCGQNYRTPLLQGRKYSVSDKSDKGRQGKIKHSELYWREENFRQGLNIYYTNIKESDKDHFDAITNYVIKKIEN